jgi:biotin operon repressor
MRYRKSLEIELRLAETLRLIGTGKYSSPLLAETIGVSIPTISRYVTALRNRGYEIKSMKKAKGWRYELGTMRRPRATSGTKAFAK